MLKVYLSVLQNEVRRLWRRRSFWIIHGLLAGLPALILLLFAGTPGIPLQDGLYIPGVSTLALYYLVLPILAGPAILNHLGQVGEIVWSSPLDSLTHFAGVFSGLWLGLAAGVAMQLGGWFLAHLLLVDFLPGQVWLFSLSIYLLALTLGLSLTFLLAMLVRRILPVLLIGAGLWVWTYLSVVFAEALAEGFLALSGSAFRNVFFHNLALSPSLGLGLEADQVRGMFAWFLGLSLAAAGLALVLAPRADPRRATRLAWFAPLLLVLGVAAAAAGYGVNHSALAAHASPPSPRQVQIDAWEVLSQRTLVEVDASRGAVAGSSQLQLAPRLASGPAEIVLRLNPGLALTAVRGEGGQALASLRVGDSVVIDLGSPPQGPVSLELAWEGVLQIPYTAYEQRWRHANAPYPYPFTHMPQPLQTFIQPVGGYLLRDGDWKPWPWTTQPHQADENYLAVRAQGGEAVASVPMEDGAAVWEGRLPDGLLAFLPDRQTTVAGMTVAVSPLAGTLHQEQAKLFAEAAGQVAALFAALPPRYVVVAPYLSNLVWSGELLLVPDASGQYLARPVGWLYQREAAGEAGPAIRRATLAALARSYLLDQIPAERREFQPRLFPRGGEAQVVDITAVSEQDWQGKNGQWVQRPEQFDVLTTYNPRRQLALSRQGEWGVVAFWLGMELADESTRQADQALLAFFLGEGKPERNFTNRDHALAWKLAWPDVLEVEEARIQVQQLHRWTAAVGRDRALSLLAAAIAETRPETVPALCAELERRSGIRIGEAQR